MRVNMSPKKILTEFLFSISIIVVVFSFALYVKKAVAELPYFPVITWDQPEQYTDNSPLDYTKDLSHNTLYCTGLKKIEIVGSVKPHKYVGEKDVFKPAKYQCYMTATDKLSGNESGVSNKVSFVIKPPVIVKPAELVFTTDKNAIRKNTQVTLKWVSTRATKCSASGAWKGDKPTSGSQIIHNVSATRSFTLTCDGEGGSVTDTLTIKVPTPKQLQINID